MEDSMHVFNWDKKFQIHLEEYIWIVTQRIVL